MFINSQKVNPLKRNVKFTTYQEFRSSLGYSNHFFSRFFQDINCFHVHVNYIVAITTLLDVFRFRNGQSWVQVCLMKSHFCFKVQFLVQEKLFNFIWCIHRSMFKRPEECVKIVTSVFVGIVLGIFIGLSLPNKVHLFLRLLYKCYSLKNGRWKLT